MVRGLSGKKLINQIARPLPCPLNREPRHKQACGASFRSLGVWVSDFTWRSIIERALTATKEAQFVRQKEKERERERVSDNSDEACRKSVLYPLRAFDIRKAAKDDNCFFQGVTKKILSLSEGAKCG